MEPNFPVDNDDAEIVSGDDSKQIKKSFFQKVKNIFGLLFKKRRKILKGTHFYDFANTKDLSDKEYNTIKKAASYCEAGMKIAEERFKRLQRHSEVLNDIKDLEKIKQLTEEELEQVKNIISSLENVTKEKHSLQYQMNASDHSLYYLSRLEDEITDAIKEMEEAEHRQSLIRQDIEYINAEKEELINEKESLEDGLVFVFRFTIVLVCAFAVAAFILGVLNFFYDTNVFIIAAVSLVLAIFFGTIIYISRRQMKFEIKKNVLLQMRAVELLNAKKLQFVHYTNFLNFEYKKFRVKNSSTLKDNWKEYNYFKHLNGRFNNIKNIVYEMESRLHTFLEERGIRDTKNTIDCLVKINNFEANKKMEDYLATESKKLETKLSALEKDQEEIWNQLNTLKDSSPSLENMFDEMLQNYLNDIETLFNEKMVQV